MQIKSKTVWVGAREKKCIFVSLFCPQKIFNNWLLSQYIVNWINFQNIYTFTYQKALFHTLLLLVLKIVESFQCILQTIYFSYIHSCLNYAIIIWGSTHITKLDKIHIQQNHAAHIVFHEIKLCHSKTFLRSLNALNVHQINLYQHLNFM